MAYDNIFLNYLFTVELLLALILKAINPIHNANSN